MVKSILLSPLGPEKVEGFQGSLVMKRLLSVWPENQMTDLDLESQHIITDFPSFCLTTAEMLERISEVGLLEDGMRLRDKACLRY